MEDPKVFDRAARYLSEQLAAYVWMPEEDEEGTIIEMEDLATSLYEDALEVARAKEGSDSDGRE